MTEQSEQSEPTKALSVEELLSLGKEHLTRIFVFELLDGSKVEREVTFRRLSYKEITELSKIPEEKPDRYTKAVIHLASIFPGFDNTDEVSEAPSGFVRHYSALILKESGKTPFLG